jgi:G2/mitotic-specific cyclin 1/2
VTNAPKNLDQAKGDKEKDREIKRPVARRTRSNVAGPAPEGKVIVAAPKRKIVAAPTRTSATSRSRSTTASNHDEGILKDREQNIDNKVEYQVQPEPEPARKKRKTSSPALEEEGDFQAETEDLADPGVYDEDGQEVLLSSGRKGTSLRSPKRSARAKDDGWTDLDAEDEGDPAMVAEYVVDAFKYMMRIEVSWSSSHGYCADDRPRQCH